MNDFLQEPRFDFISQSDKAFIRAFDAEMNRLGYDFGDQIGSGYCWGKYMLIYRKTGAKSQAVYARIYLREGGVVLRMFLNNVDRHRAFIEQAPAHIQEAFTGSFGDCKHDRVDADGGCRFRKAYTLHGRLIEKCNGITFEFWNPAAHPLEDYVALFQEFFLGKRAKAAVA